MGYILMNVGVNNRASTINQIFVGVNNIARLVYQGGGGSGNFQLPTFTGSSSIFGDTTSGRIELYESGTLVLFPGTYELFAVGGGGGGGNEDGVDGNGGGGGGGGYTSVSSRTINAKTEVSVTVGAGGTGQAIDGGSSTIIENTGGSQINYITANGGKGAPYNTGTGRGGDGGSGGGTYARSLSGYSAGSGGSDGSDGTLGTNVSSGAGVGQHTTTRMFHEEENTLYAGGGGGAGGSRGGIANGGAGGGGNMDTAGTVNTGGGGGGAKSAANNYQGIGRSGGSGIVIVRWNNAGGNYSPTLADNTWAQIDAACKANDPILDSWKVGDEKDAVVNGETLTFVIVGKNHDDLADGSGKAKLTFGMKELMASTRKMNSSNTNTGSFAGSAMYTWLSGTVYPSLPSELKDVVKAVRKKTSSGSSSSSIKTDEMYLWLFAEIEVFGSTTHSYAGEGAQYPYFATASERIKRLSNGAGEAYQWWERSLYGDFAGDFCDVTPSGAADYGYASHPKGVCFGFCI